MLLVPYDTNSVKLLILFHNIKHTQIQYTIQQDCKVYKNGNIIMVLAQYMLDNIHHIT